jgi:hypothetical protein
MITQKDVLKLKNWFEEYVESFRDKDEKIQRNYDLKLLHTHNVCKYIVEIAKDIGLNTNDINIAEIIALFHDLGRFEQYYKYKTFVDRNSENHSELAIKIINKYSLLEKFDNSTKETIRKAILNHNKISIENEEDKNIILFSKLIRDADKLDIYRVVTEYYKNKKYEKNDTIELGLDDNNDSYSIDIYNSVLNQQVVKYEALKFSNDFKLLQLSWIFDINFLYSFKIIKEKDYLALIYNTFPKIEKIKELYNKLNLYLNKNCNLFVKN